MRLKIICWLAVFVWTIIVSVLASLTYEICKFFFELFKLRSQRKIYERQKKFALIYSEMEVSPEIVPDTLRERPFVKPGIAETFSLHRMACVCEIRAASYITASLAKGHRTISSVSSDFEWEADATQSTISLGLMSNKCSRELLDMGKLIRYDAKIRHRFVSQKSGRCLNNLHSDDIAYGAIVKLFPRQNQNPMWIMCGGTGEYGTSSSAWYLADRFAEISKQIRKKGHPFVCLVRVNCKIKKAKTDTLTKMLFVAETEAEVEEHVLNGCPARNEDIASCPYNCAEALKKGYSRPNPTLVTPEEDRQPNSATNQG